MKANYVVSLFLVTLLILSISGLNIQSAIATDTLIVDVNGTADFTAIQDAVDAANFGDIITVNPGTYYERVIISKSGITLQGLDRKTTIVSNISASDISDVSISGFTVTELVFNGNNLNVIIDNNIIVGDEDWTGNLIWDNGICVVDFDDDVYTGLTIYGENNIITNNIILNTVIGVEISGNNNFVYNNDFVNQQVPVVVLSDSQVNWNDGSKGNYWGDYEGIDENNDGIGDTPYVIDENNQDNFPLMDMQVPDLDGDGIYNDLDTQPLQFSNFFSDCFKGGGVDAGVWRCGHTVTIKDEPSPFGVRISVNPSEIDTKLWILSYPQNYTLEAGSEMIFTYGSEHVKVENGEVYADFYLEPNKKLTMNLVVGDEIIWEPLTLTLENNGANSIIASAFNQEFIVEPGNTLRFTPSVTFTPTTFVYQNSGKWITAHIEGSAINCASEINYESVKLQVNDVFINPDSNAPRSLGDFDENGITDLSVKFLKNEIISNLNPFDYQSLNDVEFTITGTYTNGESFSCSNTIRVLVPKN